MTTDFIPINQLIEMYEALRSSNTAARNCCAQMLVRRIRNEAPSPTVGVSHNGVTYALDATGELCRHIVKKRKYTKSQLAEQPQRIFRVVEH